MSVSTKIVHSNIDADVRVCTCLCLHTFHLCRRLGFSLLFVVCSLFMVMCGYTSWFFILAGWDVLELSRERGNDMFLFFSGDTRVADAAISRFAPFEVSTHCPSFSPLAIEKRTGWGQIALADHVTFQQTNATAEADKQTSTTKSLFKAHWKREQLPCSSSSDSLRRSSA